MTRAPKTSADSAKICPPFGGYDPADLELARRIATETVETYGEFSTDAKWARFRTNGIWNDHPAVQAALAAIRIVARSNEAAKAAKMREALETIEEALSAEIKARFGTSSHMTEQEVAGNSRIYALLVVPRNIARSALEPQPIAEGLAGEVG